MPRVHGTGLFKRGQTQVLTFATLGAPGDAQILDGLLEEEDKRYMHQYNFPPFCVGDTKPLRNPKQKEIRHSHASETSALPIATRCCCPPESFITFLVISSLLNPRSRSMSSFAVGFTSLKFSIGVM